jgi:outer membrane protein
MKKVIGLFVFVLLMSCQEAKIAYVDYPTLLDGYERKKDVETKYQFQAEAYTRRRDSISQAFQLQAQELQTQTASMSQQAAQEQMNALQQRAQLIGQQLQQEEAQMQRMGQMKSDSIRTKVEETIADYAKKNGYAYILASGEGSSVLYGEDTRNITETILEILNEEYKK